MKAAQRCPAAIDAEFYHDVVAGLAGVRKTLPCKYFYDATGSALFERICELEEYYLTRTEMAILRRHLPEMCQWIGPQARIVEFGAGAGTKTELLLHALDAPAAYLPIDISAHALADCSRRLSGLFPHIPVKPICADYLQDALFEKLADGQPLTIFFPGSTLGNFEKAEAAAFLRRMKKLMGKAGGMLIGVDLMKDEPALLAAYNDRQGVTAAFNKNLLRRINDELEGDFDLDAFAHRAIVNPHEARVEMYLVSQRAQAVRVADRMFSFAAGEAIHTENSHKYTLMAFSTLAEASGLAVCQTWTDEAQRFSVHYVKAC